MTDLETPWAQPGTPQGEWEQPWGQPAAPLGEWEQPWGQPEAPQGTHSPCVCREHEGLPEHKAVNELLVGEGAARVCVPARTVPLPLIHMSTAAARSWNPAVGHAQQLLNRFLAQARAGSLPCAQGQGGTAQYIAWILQQLRRNGQDPLVVDCRFGPSTDLATKAFQACHGLLRDGKIGEQTWPPLERFVGTVPQPSVPPVVPPAPTQLAVREDAWSLPRDAGGWADTLHWYAVAVRALQPTPPTPLFTDWTNAGRWGVLAEPHATKCLHGQYFFLPWHRAYLNWFESIVRAEIVRAHGPASWALPYWDYSDERQPNARTLPPEFRALTMRDGTRNPLLELRRDPLVNGTNPAALDPLDVRLDALNLVPFADVRGLGFGGRSKAAGRRGGEPGQVESSPHNWVHGWVAGDTGLMGNFDTAGLDPIFWLHHANIDRLWESWLALGRRNPTDDGQWMNHAYPEFTPPGGRAPTTRDLLSTTALGFRYATLSSPPTTRPTPEVEVAGHWEAVGGRPPEVVGGTRSPTPIGAQVSVANVSITPPTGPGAREMADEAGPRPGTRVLLRLENVTATKPGVGVRVYLNVPDPVRAAEHPDHYVGSIPMFGVKESSRSDDRHSGSGISFTMDITELVERLRQRGQWDPTQLRVTFVPAPRPDGSVPSTDTAVGRVSLIFA